MSELTIKQLRLAARCARHYPKGKGHQYMSIGSNETPCQLGNYALSTLRKYG
jgi:hypothetical protein